MSADLEQPVTEPEAPPAVAEETPPETQEAVAEREVDTDTLKIPDSTQPEGVIEYTPRSALLGVKKELKETKDRLSAAEAGSAKAAQLEQQIAALQAQVQQMSPYVQAYQAAIQQQPPQQVQEDDTEARDLATSLDLWKPDGSPDVDKARKVLGVVDRRSKALADQSTAPLIQRNVRQQSDYNLQRALNTEVGGVKPDPAITKALWARLDPSVTAEEDTAKLVVIQALGIMQLQGKGAPRTPPKEADDPLPPPLHVERAGGKDTPNAMPLSDAEKRAAKDMGMTEKQYLEAADAPWLRKEK